MKAVIPPPLVFLICAALMWLADALFPLFDVVLSHSTMLFWIVLLAGFSFLASAVFRIIKRKTTIHPDKKSLPQATSLITTGIFKYSRNPIYLGMAIMLFAWVIFLENLLSAAGVIIFIAFITRYQIKPEEEALEKIFGEEYIRYKRGVRRWI